MTYPAHIATLTAELQQLQAQWSALPAAEARQFYATHFAQSFVPLFADLPLHGAPAEFERPLGLVAVLGMSWQPVALMAAWARPQRMLMIGTKESFSAVEGESVVSLVCRIAGLDRDALATVTVSDHDETEIYRVVRDFLSETQFAPRRVFIDPTGGKKSMSVAASLAGFLAGAPLVYVDYAEYKPDGRIPLAGTEYPRLLTNPLQELGDLELRDIATSFDRSDFTTAVNLAKRLAQRLYEPRQAECLQCLAEGYGAWDAWDFERADASLREAEDHIKRFASAGRWSWHEALLPVLRENLAALGALAATPEKPASIEEVAPLLAWYMAKATRMLDTNKPSLTVLLTYAALERYIDACLWVEYGLDDDKPDYELIRPLLDDKAYEAAGRRMFGKSYEARALGGKLMFGNGAQLLAALDNTWLTADDLGPLQGLANARNKCEYEHGLKPVIPAPDKAEAYLNHARNIIARIGGESALAQNAFRFPRLNGTLSRSS